MRDRVLEHDRVEVRVGQRELPVRRAHNRAHPLMQAARRESLSRFPLHEGMSGITATIPKVF